MSEEFQFKEEYARLMDEGYSLGNTKDAVVIFERAINLADKHGDSQRAYFARLEYVDACCFSGNHERAMVAFSWLLAHCDDEETEASDHDVLWKFKWILEHMAFVPTISRAQIISTGEEMIRRFEKHGYTARPGFCISAWAAAWIGDFETMATNVKKWRGTSRDRMSDCVACETDYNIRFAIFERDYEKAITFAEPVLSGRHRCAEVPHIPFSYLPLVMLEVGDTRAPDIQKRGYDLIKGNPDFVLEMSHHLEFLFKTEEWDRGLQAAQTHFGWLFHGIPNLKHAYFAATLEPWVRRAIANNLEFRLPAYLVSNLNIDSLESTLDWLAERRAKSSKQFDTRNGNTVVSSELSRLA